MGSLPRHRPSPAMAVALLALFVALGGSSYAVVRVGSKQIVDNSVRSKDIRNNEVGSRDIRNNGVLGRDVRESSLGKVPNADKVDGLDSTQFLRSNTIAFLPVGGKAADADKLDGIDSTGFLSTSGKAADSDKLDGIESTGFVKGPAAVSLIDETIVDPDGAGGAKGFSATVNVPGASIVAACLQQSGGIEMFLNKASGVASVRLWRDDGGANPTVKTLAFDPGDPGSDSDSAPVSAADRVIWHGSSPVGTFTAVLLTRYEGGNTCHWSGYVLKSS